MDWDKATVKDLVAQINENNSSLEKKKTVLASIYHTIFVISHK